MTHWLFLALPFPDAVPSDTGGSNDIHIFSILIDPPYHCEWSVYLCVSVYVLWLRGEWIVLMMCTICNCCYSSGRASRVVVTIKGGVITSSFTVPLRFSSSSALIPVGRGVAVVGKNPQPLHALQV